jgi:hypothetical protein
MRKKTLKPLDVAAISLAWEDLFNQNKAHTIESLKKDGWISVIEIASKINKSRSATKIAMDKAGLEYKKFGVTIDGYVKNVGFFKLKN